MATHIFSIDYLKTSKLNKFVAKHISGRLCASAVGVGIGSCGMAGHASRRCSWFFHWVCPGTSREQAQAVAASICCCGVMPAISSEHHTTRSPFCVCCQESAQATPPQGSSSCKQHLLSNPATRKQATKPRKQATKTTRNKEETTS